MRIVQCDICGKTIKDEHYIFPLSYKFQWVVPSMKFVRKHDVCRWCGNELIKLIEERSKDEHKE